MAIDLSWLAGVSDGISTFLQVFSWGLLVAGVIGFLMYVRMFNYVIEKNIISGTGILIKNVAARKTESDGVTSLKTLMGKETFVYPADNKLIYKKGLRFFIRYLYKSADDHYPIGLQIQNEKLIFVPVPQNLRYLNRQRQEGINRKYKQSKDFFERYGQIIGMGVLVMGFVLAVFFILERVDVIIQTAPSIVSQCFTAAQNLQVIE